jgi:hypothetical protein
MNENPKESPLPRFNPDMSYFCGTSDSGKSYTGIDKHRNGQKFDAAGKPIAKWAVEHMAEFAEFCRSDLEVWQGDDGDLWGINIERTLGVDGEFICKFPCPENETDHWHGYPASPKIHGTKDRPPKSVLNRWVHDGLISTGTKKKLNRSKL